MQLGELHERMRQMQAPIWTEDNMLVHTFSIVARDQETGELGAAVQSHFFNVGAMVTWAEAAVGAVVTQSFANYDYGPEGLERLRHGQTANQALQEMLAADSSAEFRQAAIVDRHGDVAVHTGSRCVPESGHLTGDGFSVQANMMANAAVWAAMHQAYVSTTGDLAERMLAALDAAQTAGGDVRGQQSAALLVVSGQRQDKPGKARIFDLRVEDHSAPLVELRRLLRYARAYRLLRPLTAGITAGSLKEVTSTVQSMLSLAPEVDELKVWSAVALAQAGDPDAAAQLFGAAVQANPVWREYIRRLTAVGLLPIDHETLVRLLGTAPRSE